MKKKITAVILMLAFSVSLLYGCGLMRTNVERDMAQVVARVSTGDPDDMYEDVIYKRDLQRLYQSQGQTYVNSYGYSVKDTVDLLLENLINNKLIIQEAVKTLAKEHETELRAKYGDAATQRKTYLEKSDTVKKSVSLLKLLGIIDPQTGDGSAEDLTGAYGTARGNINKYYTETLDSYEAEVKKEQGIEDEEEEEEEEDDRPVREPDVPEKEEPTPWEGEPEEDTRKEALRQFKNDLLTQDMTLEEFLEESMVSELETLLMEFYVEHLYMEMTRDNLTFKAMSDRFDIMQSMEEQQYLLNINSYKNALGARTADTFMFYHPLSGYGYVKNLLISDAKFNMEIAKLQAKGDSRAKYVTEREALLNNIKVKDLRKESEDKTLTPAFSNINMKATDFFLNSGEAAEGVLGIVGLLGGTKAEGDYNYKQNLDPKSETFLSIMDTFIDYIFMFNTDPGMFNNDLDYLSSPKPDVNGSETYVQEFADAARWTVESGVGSYTMVGTDFGWHIVVCTEKIEGTGDELSEDIYNAIQQALADGQKFDELSREVRKTTTYMLYNVMREEMKNKYFEVTLNAMIKEAQQHIVYNKPAYESMYTQ